MRLRIVSDIHVDAFGGVGLEACGQGDLTIFAGDWANGHFLLERGYAGLEPDGPLLAVAGNHEWYGLDLAHDWSRLQQLARAAGIRLLDRDSVAVDGWTILACSLWTDFALAGTPERSARIARACLSDFIGITCDGGPLQPEHLVERYRRDHAWLDAQLTAHDPASCIVVTHFGPHPNSVHDLYLQEPDASLNPYFVSDTGLIEAHQPALWIHGHTHQVLDYTVGRTRVICNPRGYPGETQRTPFAPDRIVELASGQPG